MYVSAAGLGDPYVLGNDGTHIVDCGGMSGLAQWNCWNPFAHTYSMLDFTTQPDLGPAASAATIAAVAADTASVIAQQSALNPQAAAIASSDDPDIAAGEQAAGQFAGDVVSGAASAAGNVITGALPTLPGWAWAVIIGGGALLLMKMAGGR